MVFTVSPVWFQLFLPAGLVGTRHRSVSANRAGCGEDRHAARAHLKESFELHDATETPIRCTRRRFEPGDPTTLSNRPPREKLVEVLKAPLAVKFLIQRVVQLTGIDVPGLMI